MTHAKKTTHRPKSGNIRQATAIVRLRRDCEDSLVGASQTDRRFLRRSIALLDRVISLFMELDLAADSMRKLASWKRRPRAAQSARAGR